MEGVEESLRRLGLDYTDHLVIHRHPHGVPGHVDVPIEETPEALHDPVRAGKVLYLGASSMFAWQFAEIQLDADKPRSRASLQIGSVRKRRSSKREEHSHVPARPCSIPGRNPP